MSAVTRSSSHPSLRFVQTESVSMIYLICKTCFQATNCCKRREVNIWKFYVGRYIFVIVGAGQMAASHSSFTFLSKCVWSVAFSITRFVTAVLFDQKNSLLKMHTLNDSYFGFLLLTGSLSKFPLPDKSELISSCSTSSTSVFQNYAMEVQDGLLILSDDVFKYKCYLNLS